MSGHTATIAVVLILVFLGRAEAVQRHQDATWLQDVATGSGNLLSTWTQRHSGIFSLNMIDPNTGVQGQQVYTTGQFFQFFAGNAGIDYSKKRVFIAGMGEFGGALLGLKISGSSGATVAANASYPNQYTLAVQYDSMTDRVFIVSSPLSARGADDLPIFSIGYVTLSTNEYFNFTTLNPDMYPAEQGIGGGSSVLLANKRLLVLGTAKVTDQDPDGTGYLSLIHLDSGKVVDVPLGPYMVAAMAFNAPTGQIVAMLRSENTTYLTYGIIGINGQVTAIRTWKDPAFTSIVGSLATIDSDNGRLYSVMGNGQTHTALVAIDTQTGEKLNAAYFQDNEPRSIFYLPN